MAVYSKTEFLPCFPLVFLIQDEASEGSIHLTQSKKMGRLASHIIVSYYFREQYQFPTQHLFVEEIEMPFPYEQHDQFLLTTWPSILGTRSGSNSLGPSLNRVAISLSAWLHPPFRMWRSCPGCLGHTELSAGFSPLLQDLGRRSSYPLNLNFLFASDSS